MTVLIYITCFLLALCLGLELRRDLMMLQQNSYRRERYMKWLKTSGDTTSVSRLIAIAIFFLSLSGLNIENFAIACMAVFAIFQSWKLFTAKYKKPLVMTARATRIYVTEILLSAIIILASVLVAFSATKMPPAAIAAIALTGCYCLSHVITIVVNILLSPIERSINRKYYNDAAERLASMPNLKIIGITGSYGKTSTKHYLHRILSEHFDTLMTPGSYNTTLGVVRTIREHLKPYNEVFIVEMGAKQPNDIAEICELVHPSIGIVTAVGPQHLESFKTIENVRNTKFELIDSLPADGLAVINDDFEMIATRSVDNVKTIRYAVKNTACANFIADEIRYTPHGTTFAIRGPEDFVLILETRLVGECNISNLIAAVIVALEMGMPADKIRYAVSQIEQVEHRLNIKHTPGGLTIIDDAFNSNPAGSAMALEVLSMMTQGRRIVITPGMIELGERQEELNQDFGRHIAHSCDMAFIVGHYNRQAIVDGITEGGMDMSCVKTFETFRQAQEYLNKTFKRGDTVLYENDLPDTFK